MGSKTGVQHYFAEGITARGYISLLPMLIPDWQRIYVLIGGPGTGKSTLIKGLGLELLDRGYNIDFLRSARDVDSMAGFVLPKIGLGMIDELELSPLRRRAPGVVERFIDFNRFCDEQKLSKHRTEIIALSDQLIHLQKEVEKQLIHALEEGKEPLVGKNRHVCHDLSWSLEIKQTFDQRTEKSGPWPQAHHVLKKLQMSKMTPCFLHGLAPEGWVNLAPHFMADCDQICLEGKETLDALNWVFSEAQQLGQVMKIVLHPVNPDEVIGIVFPERHLAIWQGNPAQLDEQGLSPLWGDKLKETLTTYHHQRSLLKRIYTDSTDFSQIDQTREDLLNRILFQIAELERTKSELSS